MDKKKIDRLIRIVRKTGSPLVISEGSDEFVLMDLDQYEIMIGIGNVSNEIEHNHNQDIIEDDLTPGEHLVPEEFFMPEVGNEEKSGISNITEEKNKSADEYIGSVNEEQFYLEPIE